MAFQSNGPMALMLPPFRGVTRRIILTAVVLYLVSLVLSLTLIDTYVLFVGFLELEPKYVAQKLIWELVTYPFVSGGLLAVLFSALSVWFFGSSLEDERGRRWMGEYFLCTTVGGALLTVVLTYALQGRVPGIDINLAAGGLWPFSLALVVAFACFHPEQTVRFNFLFQVKAKYLASIYVLVYLAMLLAGRESYAMLLTLSNVVAGYAFLRLAPRRGVRVGVSEWIFGLRNAWYRAKRRRAAKKFVVYMRKQGKDVSLDAEGRYVDPDGTPRDINDRRWMN